MVKQRSPGFYRVIGMIGTSRVITRLHPHVYRLVGGRGFVGRNVGGVRNVILLTTVRRTGRVRETPLFGFETGGRVVVIGSNAGGPREPAWVGNLRAEPRARLRIGREVRDIRAREADGEERETLWRLAADGYPGYELYRELTDRRIPVVVLEPDIAPAPEG